MRKVIMSFAVIFAAVLSVNAQDKKPFQLGIGVNVGLPAGNSGTVSSFGIGGRIQGEIPLAPQFTGVGSVSYNRFFYKKAYKDLLGTSGFNAIPIQVGA